MTCIAAVPSCDADHAAANLVAGARAIGLTLELPPLEWRRARDGSLTALIDGHWLAGCSVPRRAAERMLEKTTVRGNVACLLLPTHAQQVAVALERFGPQVAVIAVLASADDLPAMLACQDFSGAITARRLFFVFDAATLDRFFASEPGLPLPQQFVKLPTTDPAAGDQAVAWAQQVFTRHGRRHAERLSAARRPGVPGRGLCVAVGRSFRLWADAGDALARALDAEVIDTDLPASSAVAYVAERAMSAAALLTVDVGRADGAGLIAADRPWLTWVTRRRVPAFVPESPRDGLLLVDDSLMVSALAAGWPRERIAIAAWPCRSSGVSVSSTSKKAALIADVPDLAPPAEVEDFSSWRLVWEACRAELLQKPQALGDDPIAYLHRVRQRQGVPADNFPETLLLERLIEPASVIGTAHWLLREGVPLSIHGHGWNAHADCAPAWQGPVATRDTFEAVIASAGALIDPFFIRPGAPVCSAGRPSVRTVGRTPQRVLQDARQGAAGQLPTSPAVPAIHADLVRRFIAL